MFVLLFKHANEYNRYVRRIQSEYSDIKHREILWSWVCYAGFTMQIMIFVIYEAIWSQTIEYIYITICVLNATCLCYCTCKQKTIDLDLVDEDTTSDAKPAGKSSDKEKTLFSSIEHKLESLCEDTQLFLDPELTLETLCLHICVSRTYLGMYFRDRKTTYYQYINTLRAEYAYKLMQENPDMSISDICLHSGFRSQTTFRKIFKEAVGRLPSEIKRVKTINNYINLKQK